MIETMISGTAGSDCVASSPMEAYTLAHAQSQAAFADIGPQGASAGDELPVVGPYTPAGDDQGRPGPRG